MTDLQERGHLLTEQVNPDSLNLDQLSSIEFVELFNREDAKAVAAVARVKQDLAKAIDLSAQSLEKGGRLFYVGAGTSGRLGVLDAAECPPTFCTPPELVQGIIAVCAGALVRSSEDLEDWGESINPEFASSWGLLDIAYRTSEELWVTGGSGNLLMSPDGGETWQKDKAVENVPTNFYRVKFLGTDKGYILGQRGYLLRYNDQNAELA